MMENLNEITEEHFEVPYEESQDKENLDISLISVNITPSITRGRKRTRDDIGHELMAEWCKIGDVGREALETYYKEANERMEENL